MMRIAYVTSRFPLPSETFILRELIAVDATGDVEIELLSLFAPTNPSLHPAAQPWRARLRTPSAATAVAGLAYWLLRRPLRLARVIAAVAWGHRRRPRRLARALAVLPLAVAHAATVRRTRVEHVHAHYATYPALTAWICRELTGVGYSFTAHAHDIFVDQLFLARLVRDARFVVAISEYNRRFLRARAGADTPVDVVHCGVRPADYAFRVRPAPAEGPVRALCVASLAEYKGHRFLLDALAARPAELARMQVDLVGAGPLEDDLRGQAARLGLGDRVRFDGARSEQEVSDLLARSDLFVLPSVVAADGQMEGVPVALMEALAAGVPTIATRLSGIPELVIDGETGTLVEPGDVQGLARALVAAMAPGPAGAERAQAGRRLVETEFDAERSAALLVARFAAAVADQRVGS